MSIFKRVQGLPKIYVQHVGKTLVIPDGWFTYKVASEKESTGVERFYKVKSAHSACVMSTFEAITFISKLFCYLVVCSRATCRYSVLDCGRI